MFRFVCVMLAIASLFALAATANAQCTGPQCSTPAAACVGGQCNLQANAAAVAAPAPLPVAPVVAVPSASRSVAVSKVRTGGPLADMAARRAERAASRAVRAKSRSRAVSRVRVSANVRHDFVGAAESVAALDTPQPIQLVTTPVVQPSVSALAVVR